MTVSPFSKISSPSLSNQNINSNQTQNLKTSTTTKLPITTTGSIRTVVLDEADKMLSSAGIAE